MAKAQDGELKYLMTFSTTEAAVFWCSQLQMAALFAPWPETALRYWPEERGVGENVGVLLFRGPRIKMGIAEGHLRRIAADWTGRADCHGDSVNQAARFMDASAWGGQVALEEGVAVKAMKAMMLSLCDHQATAEQDPHFDKGSYSRDEIALAQPPSNSTQEIHPDVAEEASLSLEVFASPFSFNHPGSSRPSKLSPSTLSGSNSFTKVLKPSAARWILPASQHLLQDDPFTLTCQSLGRFSFKGSDEILTMVNLTPASLLARHYPPEAPTGKGERVSLPSTPDEEVSRVDLPKMHFISSMREEYLAQTTSNRLAKISKKGRERTVNFGRQSRLMRVTEEGEGSVSAAGDSVRPSLVSAAGWRDSSSRMSVPQYNRS